MSQSEPWYSKHLNAANLCLLTGILFILFGSAKKIKFFTIELNPSEDLSSIARFILINIGIVLILSGLTLNFHGTKYWKPSFSYIFLSLNIISLLPIWIFIITNTGQKPTEEEHRYFNWWDASRKSFEATIITEKLQKDRNTHKIFVICRKFDSTVDRLEDLNIEKSNLYTIENHGTQSVSVKFSDKFSQTLAVGDHIQGAVSLVPNNLKEDNVSSLSELQGLNAKILEHQSIGIKCEG
jgi:hypothetical protein